jgi:hypothetical protein
MRLSRSDRIKQKNNVQQARASQGRHNFSDITPPSKPSNQWKDLPGREIARISIRPGTNDKSWEIMVTKANGDTTRLVAIATSAFHSEDAKRRLELKYPL